MRSLWILVAIAAPIACTEHGKGGGGGPTAAVTIASAEASCRTGCEHDASCGISTDVNQCTMDCQNQFAGWMRQDALDQLADCSQQLACGDSNTCIDQIMPLPIHTQYETACRAALACEPDVDARCEVDAPPAGSTETLIRFIAPEIVMDMIDCFTGSDCAGAATCVESIEASVGFPAIASDTGGGGGAP
jgi:hypothetical protein